jgi:4-diphosphocytidyl-2-C-methyl-D-erythritol kinase
VIRELAPAKVNLVLRIGPADPKRLLHEVCSLFASLELADVVEVEESEHDSIECDGVDGRNLAEDALRAFRDAHPLPPLAVRIEKRIPIAGGLAGGSADAAAVLRAANEIAGRPFEGDRLRAIAAPLGSDVPSQVEPAHSIVTGTGERVERVRLPEMGVVLVPSEVGLSTKDVFKKFDREFGGLGLHAPLACDDLRDLAASEPARIAARLENQLQPPALAFRPELQARIDTLTDAGALGAQVSGSGPTVFGLFADRAAAEDAARGIPGALVTIVAAR